MKMVIVTGASSGIGAETAKRFAEGGFNVVVAYRENKEGAEKTAQEVKKAGSTPFVFPCDLGEDGAAKNLIETVVREFGSLDVLVNNAGGYLSGDEWDGATDVWIETLRKNLISAMNVSKYAIRQFQKQKSGVIISIASRHGLSGQYDATAYAAAKAGIINITQAYAKLLAPYGRANSVSPGSVNTGYWLTAPKDELGGSLADTPLKKLAETADIAEAIFFLASDKARMITGQNLVVDGGYLLK